MDYDEDLSAPVWDELNDHTSSPANEVNSDISKIAASELETVTDDDENTSTNFTGRHETSEYQLGQTSPEEEAKNNYGVQSSSNLLEELAPEREAFSDLNLGTNSNPVSPIKKSGDPLFSGSTYLPLVSGNAEPTVEEEADYTSGTSGQSSSKRKPQRLFNSARVRRRPLLDSTKSVGKSSEEDKISDPLGEFKKENEFQDEPLDDTSSNANNKSLKGDVVDLADGELFKLSPKKHLPSNTEQSSANTQRKTTNEQATTTQDKLVVEFEIEVKDPVKVGELTSMHVEYSVATKSKLLENNFAQVNRRYTDFRWLYRQLQSNHWGTIIPSPPEKQSVGRFKQDFIENRRFQMERMLHKITESPLLQKDPDFLMFLSSPDFSIDSKNREHISGSGASSDSNDLSEIHISDIQLLGPEDAALILKSGGIDTESQKRFMNISFSSPPKYIETDDYFREHWQNAQVLEEQLRQLDKSLEMVDSERNELASVTEEFSKTMESLADLEVTKKNANLLSNFADTQRRIKESLERSSLQESLTLGVTLDEYIRSLASFKAIFNQRARLGQYLVIVEADLMKKESQLEKLHNIFKTKPNSEKVQTAKKEYQILKTRFNNIKKSWQTVGDRIKNEVENYQLEKVHDFRNSIEIFLESAIESQKENIELWETFYQNYL
ncbi:hypothetical protein HG535_0F05690 [Zygotorulaspora mrakii]|uniref:PX domain-containing protein n=1 Tax=Zygotorulaspora mrakii TaxID=42260 RepID=A0A7H9B664_ZYGMR|nr:uncharacterized protein HG535_0F05690 [Zygotorulaspora mrakii]QLG74057.1 hypothetical protein HG535_0F05690 [Zygotorulaspora mrakii]